MAPKKECFCQNIGNGLAKCTDGHIYQRTSVHSTPNEAVSAAGKNGKIKVVDGGLFGNREYHVYKRQGKVSRSSSRPSGRKGRR